MTPTWLLFLWRFNLGVGEGFEDRLHSEPYHAVTRLFHYGFCLHSGYCNPDSLCQLSLSSPNWNTHLDSCTHQQQLHIRQLYIWTVWTPHDRDALTKNTIIMYIPQNTISHLHCDICNKLIERQLKGNHFFKGQRLLSNFSPPPPFFFCSSSYSSGGSVTRYYYTFHMAEFNPHCSLSSQSH